MFGFLGLFAILTILFAADTKACGTKVCPVGKRGYFD